MIKRLNTFTINFILMVAMVSLFLLAASEGWV